MHTYAKHLNYLLDKIQQSMWRQRPRFLLCFLYLNSTWRIDFIGCIDLMKVSDYTKIIQVMCDHYSYVYILLETYIFHVITNLCAICICKRCKWWCNWIRQSPVSVLDFSKRINWEQSKNNFSSSEQSRSRNGKKLAGKCISRYRQLIATNEHSDEITPPPTSALQPPCRPTKLTTSRSVLCNHPSAALADRLKK